MHGASEDDVIDLSQSSSPLHPAKRPLVNVARALPDADVIVISDGEDVPPPLPPLPVRRVLSDAQMNIPLLRPASAGTSSSSSASVAAAADPFDGFMARVLEIVPDVAGEHLRALLEQHHPAHGDAVVEVVLHVLLEDAAYPRATTGKRKRGADDDAGPSRTSVAKKTDYTSTAREAARGPEYTSLAIAQLLSDFPYIPKPHIRYVLFSQNTFYVPAYLFLAEEARRDVLPYKKKTIPSRLPGKGRQLRDPEFEKERAWLMEYLVSKPAAVGAADAAKDEDGYEDDEECEDGIECGCCFSRYAFDKMIQCPEAHLFCRTCCRAYAANKLGEHDPRLMCMDQSGCREAFHESELERFLPPRLLALYHTVKQQKEVAAAGLEGLEECPCCEYKVVIENAEEKLFRCENAECGAVSCRACKRPDHLPKSCKEVEADKELSVRHLVEEAMTKALMRNCPKCQKAFVKEAGCNKMTCPNCGTMSCYICREVICGYDHFGNQPPYNVLQDSSKCNLWDPVEQRHNNEVIAAAKKAVEKYRALHPEVSEEALRVDLPAPVASAVVPPQQHGMYAGMPRGGVYAGMPHGGVYAGMPQHGVYAGMPQHGVYAGMLQHGVYAGMGMQQQHGVYAGMGGQAAVGHQHVHFAGVQQPVPVVPPPPPPPAFPPYAPRPRRR